MRVSVQAPPSEIAQFRRVDVPIQTTLQAIGGGWNFVRLDPVDPPVNIYPRSVTRVYATYTQASETLRRICYRQTDNAGLRGHLYGCL